MLISNKFLLISGGKYRMVASILVSVYFEEVCIYLNHLVSTPSNPYVYLSFAMNSPNLIEGGGLSSFCLVI